MEAAQQPHGREDAMQQPQPDDLSQAVAVAVLRMQKDQTLAKSEVKALKTRPSSDSLPPINYDLPPVVIRMKLGEGWRPPPDSPPDSPEQRRRRVLGPLQVPEVSENVYCASGQDDNVTKD